MRKLAEEVALNPQPHFTPRAMSASAEAEPSVYWLEDRAARRLWGRWSALSRRTASWFGGGYTGLWTAHQAKEDDLVG